MRPALRGYALSGHLHPGNRAGSGARSGHRRDLPAERQAASGGRPAHSIRLRRNAAHTIAQSGPGVMYGGELGRAIASRLEQAGSFIRLEDLANYRTIEREPVARYLSPASRSSVRRRRARAVFHTIRFSICSRPTTSVHPASARRKRCHLVDRRRQDRRRRSRARRPPTPPLSTSRSRS